MSEEDSRCTDECKPKCEKPKCCKPCCADLKCDEYSGYEIYCKWKAATVDITAQLGVSTVLNPCDASQIAYYQANGSGAIISKHLILTSSALVLAPPTAFNNAVKYPVDPCSELSCELPCDVVSMSKILVTVRNWNGRAKPSPGGKCKKEDRFDGFTLTL